MDWYMLAQSELHDDDKVYVSEEAAGSAAIERR